MAVSRNTRALFFIWCRRSALPSLFSIFVAVAVCLFFFIQLSRIIPSGPAADPQEFVSAKKPPYHHTAYPGPGTITQAWAVRDVQDSDE